MVKDFTVTSVEEHQKAASALTGIRIAVVTVSDTRTAETDKNGPWLQQQIRELEHRVVDYRIVKDDPPQIEATLQELLGGDAQILLFNGGTGISPRDNTFDVLASRLTKVMPGFGELFRMLSYQQIGAASMLSRAIAGVVDGRVLFSTPGSHGAVQLSWEKLIAPQLAHLAWEVKRPGSTDVTGAL